jgi:predicted nuclease of restriction endonuclease-like (RecB) superfamily
MNTELQTHFQNIRDIIRQGKEGALQAVNVHSIMVNWMVGGYISQQLTESLYGAKVVETFSKWLEEKEPGLKGFSRRGLYRCREFFDTWNLADFTILPISLQEKQNYNLFLSENSIQKIVPTTLAQSFEIPTILFRIGWSHHLELFSGCTSTEERLFYLVLAVKDRYTVQELRRQIKSALFERQMLAKHTLILPEHPQKALLADIFRDRYIFDFLNLQEPYSEFDLKKALVLEMKRFLLEMGRDFLFIAEEMHLKIGMDDYFIDLVFFHRELQCLVAIDLKIGAFEPEHLGKMNFYLELLDRDVRKPHENPSIGVVLCKTKNDEVVEIAMSRQLSPAMVAAYQTQFLDKILLQKMLHQWAENWKLAQKHKNK